MQVMSADCSFSTDSRSFPVGHWSWAVKLEHRAAIDFYAFAFCVPGTRATAVIGHFLFRYQTVNIFARMRMGNLKRAAMVE